MLDLECKICAEKNGKEEKSLSFNVFIPGSKPPQQGTLFMINYSTHGYLAMVEWDFS